MNTEVVKTSVLEKIINEELKPFVKKIDSEAYYAENFLKSLGKRGCFLLTARHKDNIY